MRMCRHAARFHLIAELIVSGVWLPLSIAGSATVSSTGGSGTSQSGSSGSGATPNQGRNYATNGAAVAPAPAPIPVQG